MATTIFLSALWFVLMLHSGACEYRYYQAVRTHEPETWRQLGSPLFLKVPLLFVSPRGATLLKQATDPQVRALARKHQLAGTLFIAYVISVLLGAIIYFKAA